MLELTGVASVLRGISFLYWLLAIGALTLVVWKVRKWWGKTIGVLLVLGLFGYLPATEWIEANKRDAYAREAWAYFKKKCEAEAGEKIYKTFSGVRSVLVVKPLPPATEKDLFDQFWYGDPYSNATPWDRRGELAASILADPAAPISKERQGRGFDFVESVLPGKNGALVKYYYPAGARKSEHEMIERSASRFGISWEDVSTENDRKYWVAASRLRVVNLSDGKILAERIGFLIEGGFGSKAGQRRPWLSSRGPSNTCPAVDDYSDRKFLLRVLNPAEEIRNGK